MEKSDDSDLVFILELDLLTSSPLRSDFDSLLLPAHREKSKHIDKLASQRMRKLESELENSRIYMRVS